MKSTTLSALDLGRSVAASVMEKNAPGTLCWHYETGLILLALWRFSEAVGDGSIKKYVVSHAEALVDVNGKLNGYRTDEYNLDQVNLGKILLELGLATTDGRYAKACAVLREQLSKQPRTAAGGFWHKKIYPYQMWLDGLYMQAPFSVRWGLANVDGELVDDACDQLLLVEEKTRDPATGLLRHAWDESGKQLWADPATGRSAHCWDRAMGWYAMALADVLEFLPPVHPKRGALEDLFRRTMDTVLSIRDPAALLWRQVMDQGDRPGNYFEASGSAMFCYALAKGARLGVLPATAKRAAEDSFRALSDRYLTVDGAGRGSLAGICKVAGLGGEPYRDGSYGYYIGEPVVADDFKGLGPFILASTEL